MMQRSARPLSSFLLSASLLALAGCSGSSGGGGAAPELGAPTGTSPVGNWVLDGSSIQVIADTGTPHDFRDGDPFRIGNNGVVVFAGTYALADGAIARFLTHSGAPYNINGTTAGDRFETTISTDLGLANGKLQNQDYITINCTGQVVNGQLQVQVLGLVFEAGNEVDRDELAFVCLPGSAISPNVSGTWTNASIRVVSDTAAPHDYQVGEETIVQGTTVLQLSGDPADFAAVQNALGNDFAIELYYNSAGQGRAEGVLIAAGKANTPSAGDGAILLFDLVRVGSQLNGNIFSVTTISSAEDIDDIDVNMDPKASPARLPEALVGAASDLEPARTRKLMVYAADVARSFLRR